MQHLKINIYASHNSIGTKLLTLFKQPKHTSELKLSNLFKLVNCQSFLCHYMTTTVNLCISQWAYSVHCFPSHNLISSAQTFLSFMLSSFVSSKSAFLCSLINTRIPVVTCTLSSAYFNVRLIAFIILYNRVIGHMHLLL